MLFWAIITPVVPISAYAFLKIALKAFPDSNGIHPAVYVAVGVTVWFWLRDLTFAAVSGLSRNKTMLSQSTFPLIGVVFTSYGVVAFDTLVRVLATSAIIFFLGSFSFFGVFAGLALLLIAAVMAHGFALILAVLWAGSPDTKNLVDLVFRYAFFVSNVLFALPQKGWASWLYILNPYAIVVENTRLLILTGHPRSWSEIGAIGALALVSFVVGSRLFYLAQDRIRATLV